MKKFELYFNVLSVFVDACLLALAGTLSYFLRYRTENFFPQYPIAFNLTYGEFLYKIILAVPFLIMILALYGLYSLNSTAKFWKITLRIASGISTGLMVFVAFYFFNPAIFPSRLIVLLSWILAITFVVAGRYLLAKLSRSFLKRGIGLHNLVLICDRGRDFNFEREITNHPQLGYKIVAVINEEQNLIANLQTIREQTGIDEILQAKLSLSNDLNDEILRFTHDYGIRFNYVPNIIEIQQSNLTVNTINNFPVIQLKNTPLEGWGRIVKRLIDILLSFVGIVIAAPLFIFVIIGIKLDSPGKIFFVQERYGRGQPFRFYKFRSMHQNLSVGSEYGGADAEKIRKALWKVNARQGPFLKIKNDPRVTKFGKFIRKTKLDELPQLFNVLKGDMSLTGPRAHVLDEVNRYREKYKRQFTIKPGITGLTQITQASIPDLPFDEEIRLDTFYIENWSLALDFSILLKTIVVIFHHPKKIENY